MIFALIALALLIVSVLFNFGQWMTSFVPGRGMIHTRTAGPRLEEVVLEEHDASDSGSLTTADPELRTRNAERGTQNPEPGTRNPERRTWNFERSNVRT